MSYRPLPKYFRGDPFYLTVKKTYQSIYEIIKESELTDPSKDKEFAAFVYVSLNDASSKFLIYDKDKLVYMITDLFNQSALPEEHITSDFLEDRKNLYLDIISKGQTRWEWNGFEPLMKGNESIDQIFAIFGDILVNPECVNDYTNAATVIRSADVADDYCILFQVVICNLLLELIDFSTSMQTMKQTQEILYRSMMREDERKAADVERAKRLKATKKVKPKDRVTDYKSQRIKSVIKTFFSNLVSSYGGIWYYLLISAATLVPIIALGANIVLSIFFYIFAITIPFVNIFAWLVSLPMILLEDQGYFEIIYWIVLGITFIPMVRANVTRLSDKKHNNDSKKHTEQLVNALCNIGRWIKHNLKTIIIILLSISLAVVSIALIARTTNQSKDTSKDNANDLAAVEEKHPILFTKTPQTVRCGSEACVKINGNPNTKYSIAVMYKSGPSKAAGLEDKTSDKDGNVTWRWTVSQNTTPGTFDIIVSGGGSEITTQFTVKK